MEGQQIWNRVYGEGFMTIWSPPEGTIQFTARHLKKRLTADRFQEFFPAKRVLDLGCGIMQATTDIRGTPGNEGNLNCRTILGVDVFSKYLDQIKFEYPTLNIEITNTDIFVDQSYDVVICLDVLEHLTTKREAVKLLP